MPEHSSSLGNKAFGDQANAAFIVAYQSHQDALRFLSSALAQANGIALLQGPKGAGKSTIIAEQMGWSSRDAAVARLSGRYLTPRQLLSGMLSQFDVKTPALQDEQQLQLLNKFLTEETRSRRAPLLILDDADRATPSALRLLNWLAALDARGQYALRIILTGKEQLSTIVEDDSMRSIARRHPAVYSLNPMSAQEAMNYLRSRLIAAGGERVEKIFPIALCEKLHELSGGWPGTLNKHAIDVMQRISELREARPVPKFVASRDGEMVREFELKDRQYVIGRTDLADIVIEDSYVSKMHAMVQVYANAIVLLDLNSTNGTTVNSRAVQRTVLRNNDIISLGRFRLKVENAPTISADVDERIKASDTMTMATLEDVRRLRARRTISALKRG
jgi:type II secretory pathway predicted ATPase ExeA